MQGRTCTAGLPSVGTVSESGANNVRSLLFGQMVTWQLAEMRAFLLPSCGTKCADFLCEMMVLCRFSGVEAVFTLKFPIFRANRKLVPMSTEFRKDHKMNDCSCGIFTFCTVPARMPFAHYFSSSKSAFAHLLPALYTAHRKNKK